MNNNKKTAVGSDWKNIRSELFTNEKIAESDRRVQHIGKKIKKADLRQYRILNNSHF